MNRVSPVSTPNGTASPACSQTTMLIDSGVWPGVCTDLERDVTERVALAVGDPVDRELGLGGRAVARSSRRCRGQLEVAGQEVGVEVGLDHPLDASVRASSASARYSAMSRLRVDDHGPPGGLVTDQVRGVGQAAEVVLGELHRRESFRSSDVNPIVPIPPGGMSNIPPWVPWLYRP